jgi:N-acetylglucosaminyl-diphospho-decaprenol L-rhamnosyltransferase
MSSPCIPQLSFIIVNYNTTSYLEKLVPQLYDSCPGSEIIIVDNASTISSCPSTLTLIDPLRIHLISNSKNLGFGTACNIGSTFAKANILVFLNPDCTLIGNPDFELLLSRDLSDPSIGAVAPSLFDLDFSRQQNSYSRYSSFSTLLLSVFRIGLLFRRLGLFKHNALIAKVFFCFPEAIREYIERYTSSMILEPVYLSGACLSIRSNLFRVLGGFDESYFMYYEDEDLCRRIVASGHKLVTNSSLEICHEVGASSRLSFKGFNLSARLRYGLLSSVIYFKKYNILRFWHKCVLMVAFITRILLGPIFSSPIYSIKLLASLYKELFASS